MALDRTRFIALRDELARLFPDERTARLIVKDVALDASRIDFHGAAQVIWEAIVEEADKQGRVESLVARALKGYPSNPVLGGRRAAEPRAEVLARTCSLSQRQELVSELARVAGDMSAVKRVARELALSVPEGRDAGCGWVALVQELTLRNGDLSPLYALVPGLER